MKIESLTNSHVKKWCKLNSKKYRDETGLFLVEGDHLLKEALKKGNVVEIIATEKCWQKENIPFYEVTEAILKKISSQASSTNVLAVCKRETEKEIKGNVCILDSIQDPGNLGTIIRSCVAFSIDTLIVSPNTVDVWNEKTIRASEGMLFHLNIIKKDLQKIVEELHDKGYTIYGTNVKEGTSLKDIHPKNNYAIIMGNEGSGVNLSLQKKCDKVITIPINPDCESLNVGIATSIILYAFFYKS